MEVIMRRSDEVGVETATLSFAAELPSASCAARMRVFAGIASVGSGFLLVVVGFIGWGYARFGSPVAALAYLGGNRILVSPGTHVFFGKDDEECRVTLTFQNATGKTVRIVGATATCACVAAEGVPTELPPGLSREIHAVFRISSKRSGVWQRLSFITDSPEVPYVAVRLCGRVAQD
jgi:hypothetical protein